MVNPVATLLFDAFLIGSTLVLFGIVMRSFLPPVRLDLGRWTRRIEKPDARPRVVGRLTQVR